MLIKVTSPGFFGGMRRRVGDVFEVPDGLKGTWFEPLSESSSEDLAGTTEKVGKRGRGKTASLSEIARERPVGPVDLV